MYLYDSPRSGLDLLHGTEHALPPRETVIFVREGAGALVDTEGANSAVLARPLASSSTPGMSGLEADIFGDEDSELAG